VSNRVAAKEEEPDVSEPCPAPLPPEAMDSTPSLRVGEPQTGAPRRELKFVFSAADVSRVRAVLSVNAETVSFGDGPISRVSSVYLDDDRLTSLYDSRAGIAIRSKTRLRWYDERFPRGKFILELKRRENLSVLKTRVPIYPSIPLAGNRYYDLLPALESQLSGALAHSLRSRRQATLLITYKRQHFVDRATGVRLTLDWDIAVCEQIGHFVPRMQFAVPIEGLAVIEVKADDPIEANVRELLYPLKPRLNRCSKYVIAAETVGLINDEG
jgi:hypothetical protein